jgi:putative flippase GtrA
MMMTDRMASFRGAWTFVRREQLKFRFAAAGFINTAVGLAIYPIILWTFSHAGLNYMGALFISQALSIVSAYIVTKFIAFRTRGQYFPEFGKFAIFYLLLFVVNLFALPFLVEVVRIPPIPAQLGFSLTVMLGSYFWHSRITFGKDKEDVGHNDGN